MLPCSISVGCTCRTLARLRVCRCSLSACALPVASTRLQMSRKGRSIPRIYYHARRLPSPVNICTVHGQCIAWHRQISGMGCVHHLHGPCAGLLFGKEILESKKNDFSLILRVPFPFPTVPTYVEQYKSTLSWYSSIATVEDKPPARRKGCPAEWQPFQYQASGAVV